jgi:hypothetical protein
LAWGAAFRYARTSGIWRLFASGAARALGVAGSHDRARQVVIQIQTQTHAHYVPPLPLALTYAGLGEMNTAICWLEKAVQERSLWIAWLAVDPRFDLFLGDPRYYSILERMRLLPR